MKLRKSTQWDIVGVFGFMLGLGIAVSLFGEYMPIQYRDTRSDYILWIIVGGIGIVFGFMSFIFAYFEGKKEQKSSSGHFSQNAFRSPQSSSSPTPHSTQSKSKQEIFASFDNTLATC